VWHNEAPQKGNETLGAADPKKEAKKRARFNSSERRKGG